MLEAFVSRFSRLKDTVGDTLLPTLLGASLEKVGTQFDNLSRAERFGWIASSEEWIALRELRNRLVHEYIDSAEDLLEALREALADVRVLLLARKKMAEQAQKVLN